MSEITRPDDIEALEPTPSPVSVRQRLDVFAAKVSYAMSLTMLASPFVLMLLPTPARVPSDRLPQVSSSRTGPPVQQRSPAVAAWVAGDSKPEPAPPILKTRSIPVVEVKVRRDVNPKPEVWTEPTAGKPSQPAATAHPPILAPVAAPLASSPAPTTASAPVAALPAAQSNPPPPTPSSWSEAEVSAALRTCLTTLSPLSIEMEARPPLRENICGLPAPISIRRIGTDKVEIQPPALVNCAMAKALEDWLVKIAQPAARETFGSPIVRLTGMSGYACRNRNGATDGPISEHAFGNALDVSGFVLADGRTIALSSHWGPTAKDAKSPPSVEVAASPQPPPAASLPAATRLASNEKRRSSLGGPVLTPPSTPAVATTPATGMATTGMATLPATADRSKEATFLRRIHAGACGMFGTVLGPDANEAHRDHIHIDLKGRKRTGICQ